MRAVFSSNLKTNDGMKETKLEKLKKRIDKKTVLCSEYLVVLSANPKEELEIIKANQLIWPYYENHPVMVAGVFSTYEDAVGWIAELTQECLLEQGDCKLKRYVQCHYF